MTAACEHRWKLRDDIPVRDFRPYGVSVYECVKCGAQGESDPFTGIVREDVVQRG